MRRKSLSREGSEVHKGKRKAFSIVKKGLVLFLALTLIFTPGLVQVVLAQEDSDAAPQDQVKIVQQLAQKGYLGDKKDYYLSAKNLNSDDITDALVKIYDGLSQVDLKVLKPGDATYQTGDLKTLHQLVEDKKEDVLARKVSAWKFERRLDKMVALLAPAATPGPTAAVPAVGEKTAPMASPTSTPIPAASKEEVSALREDLKDLTKKTADMQDAYEKKLVVMQKSNDDLKLSNDDLSKTNAASQEQLKLVKKLLDQVQDDLRNLDERLETVSKKASEKSVTDTELQQQLDVMHKDIRDNRQDVSILKQEVAKLDKEGEKEGQSDFDKLLASPWVGGSALVVGVIALGFAIFKR